MAKFELGVSQGVCRETYAGNSRMNRYGVFSGLERPRRIDEKHTLDANGNLLLLGYDPPSSCPQVASLFDIGQMASTRWYSYKHIGLSSMYQRPYPVADDTLAFTRSNPSPVSSAVFLDTGEHATSVAMDYIPRIDITHLGLYRSLAKTSSNQALAGNWYLTLVTSNASHAAPVRVIDVNPDHLLGEAVETDNFPPPAFPYAAEAKGTIYATGSRAIGSGLTCSVWNGSWAVVLDTAGEQFYDGIRGWAFTIIGDSDGGIDALGNYFARYLYDDPKGFAILQLLDENGDPTPYTGTTGTGKNFACFLDGRMMRWCKYQEPEAWPLGNAVLLSTEGTGIAQLPNSSMLVVLTDRPEISIFDLTSLGTPQFKTSTLASDEFTAHHFTLVPVEGRLRGLDNWRGCIWEFDGSSVRDITKGILSDIFKHLTKQQSKQKNWHGVYDAHQKIFAEFVTLSTSYRYVDYAIIQNLRTGRWFFNWEKDLLCSCRVLDPKTGRWMAFGGTQGLGASGGTWGRLWTPGWHSDWVYPGSLLSGEITLGTAPMITVDNSAGTDLQTAGDGLKGRWVLVTDENDENEQLAFISDNTANTITVNLVHGGNLPTMFSPIPEAGWKFYLGLIEVRWGPRRFTFDDPSILKQVVDIYTRIKNADTDNPPFIRLYKGNTADYERQIALTQREYIGGAATDSWGNTQAQLEATLKWGLMLVERSYEEIEIQDLTLVFNAAK